MMRITRPNRRRAHPPCGPLAKGFSRSLTLSLSRAMSAPPAPQRASRPSPSWGRRRGRSSPSAQNLPFSNSCLRLARRSNMSSESFPLRWPMQPGTPTFGRDAGPHACGRASGAPPCLDPLQRHRPRKICARFLRHSSQTPSRPCFGENTTRRLQGCFAQARLLAFRATATAFPRGWRPEQPSCQRGEVFCCVATSTPPTKRATLRAARTARHGLKPNNKRGNRPQQRPFTVSLNTKHADRPKRLDKVESQSLKYQGWRHNTFLANRPTVQTQSLAQESG